MLKHIWSVLCRQTTIDSNTNTVTIRDIFEALQIHTDKELQESRTGEIIVPVEYEIISLWKKQKEKGEISAEIRTELTDPLGKKLKLPDQKVEMPANVKRHRSRLKIQGLIVTKPGEYIFRVKIKEKGKQKFTTVAELPLEVTIKKGKL